MEGRGKRSWVFFEGSGLAVQSYRPKCQFSASVAVLSAFISPPLTLTQQGLLPWVCPPPTPTHPVECLFPD